MKKKYLGLNILILTIILGILVSFQIKSKNSKYEYVSLDTISDYKQSIEKENVEIEKMKSQIEEHKNRIKDYETIKTNDGDISKLVNNKIMEFKTVSGLTDVYGPGVMIIITDATRDLIEGEDPNMAIVHDLDILNIINDLKIAGAESISINNQRILSSTEIACSGYTIEINGRDYGLPYIIRAIGDPGHLEAAINGPESTGYLLKEFGIFVEVNTKTYIRIPKYDDDISYKYLTIEK
jgi:uncharacterized protein YlxW (UPF0749 family)